MGDSIPGFNGAFDYSTASELVEHLREHALREAGGGPSDRTYDPETFCLEMDAASAIELIIKGKIIEIQELKAEIEELRVRGGGR